jgi:hypothetical protein
MNSGMKKRFSQLSIVNYPLSIPCYFPNAERLNLPQYSMQDSPAIIVLAYQRLYSLQRLLYSLVMAGRSFDPQKPLRLIISLDDGASKEVLSFSKNFFSKYFEITLVEQETKLGVDKHNLWAMEQAEQLGSVMVLEDDTMVSPSLFHYAAHASAFFKDDPSIGGISLYNYVRNEVCHYPFCKIEEGYFNYFYQKASSRGLLITRDQWLGFRNFKPGAKAIDMPRVYQKWGDEVWEKQFNRYLISESKYWVYPRTSLTTNFGEPGAHVNKKIYRHAFQSNIQVSLQRTFDLIAFKNSKAIYDAYGEAVLVPGFKAGEITMDVLGVRDLNKITTKYILTSRHCLRSDEHYALELCPPELNVLYHQHGKDLHVAEPGAVKETRLQKQKRLLMLHYYFYPDKGLLHLLRLKLLEIFSR